MAKNRSKHGGNEGMIVSGGSVKANQIAVGRNASIKVVNAAGRALEAKGMRQVKDKLDELLAAVSAHAGPAPQREELMRSTEAVAAELASEKPNKLTITSILEGIASSVKSVTSIVSASEALKAAVTALF